MTDLESVVATAPRPPMSQPLANSLMSLYESSPDFGDVIIEDDNDLIVAIKGTKDRTEVLSGVTVRFVSVPYSRSDLDAMAAALGSENPQVHHVSYDFLQPGLLIEVHDSTPLNRSSLPDNVSITVVNSEYSLDAAEGGMLQNPGGCTTGFRMKSGQPPVWRLTTANHCTCGTGWGSVNGVSMTLQAGVCAIDTSFASGASLSTTIGSHVFSGTQGDPASGAQVYKYGVATGWIYGYRGSAGSSTISCSVPIYNYSGGTLASIGGDSGGPYVTLVWNGSGYAYEARGTHRGSSGSNKIGVRMSSVNGSGWMVG